MTRRKQERQPNSVETIFWLKGHEPDPLPAVGDVIESGGKMVRVLRTSYDGCGKRVTVALAELTPEQVMRALRLWHAPGCSCFDDKTKYPGTVGHW